MAERIGGREHKNRKTPHQSWVLWRLPGFILVFSQGQPRFYINQDVISTPTMARAEPLPSIELWWMKQDISKWLRHLEGILKKAWAVPRLLLVFLMSNHTPWGYVTLTSCQKKYLFGHDCSKFQKWHTSIKHQPNAEQSCTVTVSDQDWQAVKSLQLMQFVLKYIKHDVRLYAVDTDEQW